MITTIMKVGNSQVIILDDASMESAQLKVGDDVNLEVHASGTITLTPMRSQPDREAVSAVIKKTLTDYTQTMKQRA